MSVDEVAAKIEEDLPGILPKLGATLLEGLKDEAPAMFEDRLALRRRFSRRLWRRWSSPLKLLRMLIEAARECGEAYNSKHRPNAARDNDFVFEALVRLHARACLISDEICWLMEGGFASGAHSRWRTLHELTTVSFFIGERDQDVAERYLLHHVVESAKAADQYQKCHQALGQDAFTEAEMKEFSRDREELRCRFGNSYLEDWGWASDALHNKRPNFTAIEQAVGLEHLRPYFKMSCYSNHAGSKGLWYDLGNSLNPEDSDSGAGRSEQCRTSPSQVSVQHCHSIKSLPTSFSTKVNLISNMLIFIETMKQLSYECQQAFADVATELEILAPKIRDRLERFRSLSEGEPKG